jgi:excisionase family DNA binding protein
MGKDRDKLMTPAELADYLNVSVSCVWSQARENKLPHVHLLGWLRLTSSPTLL